MEDALPTPPSWECYTLPEVASLLRTSTAQVKRYIQRREFPTVTIDGITAVHAPALFASKPYAKAEAKRERQRIRCRATNWALQAEADHALNALREYVSQRLSSPGT
jgi:hypothetical protein